MNPFASIAGAYLRWCHSRGFGIHSPFTYNLVTTAIHPGQYGYYGYDLIEDALAGISGADYRRKRHDSRLLLRMLVTLGSRRLIIAGEKDPLLEAVAEGAGITCLPFLLTKDRISSGDLLYFEKDAVSPEEIRGPIDRGCIVMAVDSSRRHAETMIQGVARGTVLSGTRITVGIPRQEMAFVEYSMKL